MVYLFIVLKMIGIGWVMGGFIYTKSPVNHYVPSKSTAFIYEFIYLFFVIPVFRSAN